jgi:glycerol-3-phosphate dehydrogenase subunit B
VTRAVVVLGAGAAGTAAAWSAAARGARVTIIDGGLSATSLSSGAIDDAPWEAPAPPAPEALDERARAFTEALGAWEIAPDRRALVATTAGVVRPARGRDRSILDLSLFHDMWIALPRADRAGWDADALARSLDAAPTARRRGLRFAAIDGPVLRHTGEDRMSDADLAARHDDPVRLDWLAARLGDALARERARTGARFGAVLLGPWLGAREAQAEALARRVGLPAGEGIAGLGATPGLRFEAARVRLLAGVGARLLRGRAASLAREGARLAIALEGEAAPLRADAVVLAVGGLAGGGILYTPADRRAGAALPPRATPAFALSLEADVDLAALGAPVERVSSMSGPDLDGVAWPAGLAPGALEAVGVVARAGRASAGVLAAGDVIADRPRTVLEAVASGVRAGAAAAG